MRIKKNKIIVVIIVLINNVSLFSQENIEVKYDEKLIFEDSLSLSFYLNIMNDCCVHSFKQLNSKTLIEYDIYHTKYSNKKAEKYTFPIGLNGTINYKDSIKSETFFYTKENENIFINLPNQVEKKYEQYNLKRQTLAIANIDMLTKNQANYYTDDNISINSHFYECYVFEEINNNYRRLVYLEKKHLFQVKIVTFFNNGTISIIEPYSIKRQKM